MRRRLVVYVLTQVQLQEGVLETTQTIVNSYNHSVSQFKEFVVDDGEEALSSIHYIFLAGLLY